MRWQDEGMHDNQQVASCFGILWNFWIYEIKPNTFYNYQVVQKLKYIFSNIYVYGWKVRFDNKLRNNTLNLLI